MKTLTTLISFLLLSAPAAVAAADSDAFELKLTAIEALMSAPAERALPPLLRVLEGEDNAELRKRALFVLSQINLPAAHEKLVSIATDESSELRHEAIRMIGISGRPESLQAIAALANTDNPALRDAVLEAYLIAGDKARVFEFAVAANNSRDFEAAVNILAALGARKELRALRDETQDTGPLISAMGVAGDVEGLLSYARDGSDVTRQIDAIEALGLTGSGGPELIDIYQSNDDTGVREAVRHGLLVAGHDEGVLQLYREADALSEKKELLQLLVMMGSDHAMDVIDDALAGDD